MQGKVHNYTVKGRLFNLFLLGKRERVLNLNKLTEFKDRKLISYSSNIWSIHLRPFRMLEVYHEIHGDDAGLST